MWDPPVTAGVLSDLFYEVTVMNDNTGEMVVRENTNNTFCPLTGLKSCQYYTANVTAFSSQHRSESVEIGQRVPGGEWAHNFCILMCQL